MIYDGADHTRNTKHGIIILTPWGGRGPRNWVIWFNQWFNQSCQCNEAPVKTRHWNLWASLLAILCILTYQCVGRMCPWGYRREQWKLPIWDPPRAHPMHLSLWLVLIWILLLQYNCNHQCYTLLNSVSHSSKLSNLRGVVGTSEFVASWSEAKVDWGPPNMWLVCEVRAFLWRTVPLTCDTGPNSGCWCQKSLQWADKKPFEIKSGPVLGYLFMTFGLRKLNDTRSRECLP